MDFHGRKKIIDYNKYFFIFAHPDDEIYSCALMNNLSKKGKEVHAIYATSGDAGGRGVTRMRELKNSLKLIGVSIHLHLLNIPERKVLDNFKRIISKINDLIKKYNPDCFVSHDYEGGHEVHDGISYCVSESTSKRKNLIFFVFPVYHGKPQERKGARFKPTRKNIIELFLNGSERKLKASVLECHKSQTDHLDGLKKSSKDYHKLLLGREVYYRVNNPIDYQKKPMLEVGYEYHRNGFKFSDFLRAINEYKINK